MKHKIRINVNVFNDSKDLAYNAVHFLFPDENINNVSLEERSVFTAMQVAFTQLF
jgi:hypothetical protein